MPTFPPFLCDLYRAGPHDINRAAVPLLVTGPCSPTSLPFSNLLVGGVSLSPFNSPLDIWGTISDSEVRRPMLDANGNPCIRRVGGVTVFF